jgi:hypothetical protein
VDERLVLGVPHPIALEAGLSLLVVVPTGLATTWRDAPDTAVVTTSRPQAVPTRTGKEYLGVAVPHAPARVVLRLAPGSGSTVAGTGIAGAVPLVLGTRVVLPEGDPVPGPRIQLLVRDWEIRAGSLRGPGDVGSFVRLAWRRVDLPPAPDPGALP